MYICVGILIWILCGCCGDLSVWVCEFDFGGFFELAVLWVSLTYLTLVGVGCAFGFSDLLLVVCL